MLKKLIMVAAIAAFSTSAIAGNLLTSYEQIAGVLASGKNVLLNINPEKCKATGRDASHIKRLAFKFKDLFEFETSAKDGKKMRAIGIQETGLYGNTQFIWYRTLTLIMEDNSVLVFNDNVDPASFNLQDRALLTCRLSADNSGGVTATQLSN